MRSITSQCWERTIHPGNLGGGHDGRDSDEMTTKRGPSRTRRVGSLRVDEMAMSFHLA